MPKVQLSCKCIVTLRDKRASLAREVWCAAHRQAVTIERIAVAQNASDPVTVIVPLF